MRRSIGGAMLDDDGPACARFDMSTSHRSRPVEAPTRRARPSPPRQRSRGLTHTPSRRRWWSLAAILLALGAFAGALVLFVQRFPNGLSVIACIGLAALCVWYALRREGTRALVLLGLAAALGVGAIVLVLTEGQWLGDALVLAALVAGIACARNAFAVRVALPRPQPPRHPVLFFNPVSGGGKATRFHLAEEARRRGIESVELRKGDDLAQLVAEAVARGADALAAAGGDGSQAIVARIAAEEGLPYACIPAGTRNHFALDLGVDRNDVVGALDALVDGGERRVDLAKVNGRVFVNNVSLGLYAEAVQREEYRDAKLRTLAATLPSSLASDTSQHRLRWKGQHGQESGAMVLVSNNSYRLGRLLGSGTRPRLDRGLLGIAAFGSAPAGERGQRLPTRSWTAREFRVDAGDTVPAGIDGEATTLEPPLMFSSIPAALRVRIAPGHPGASPSAAEPDSPWTALATLTAFALGREGRAA